MDNQALAHQMRRHRRFAIPLHLNPLADPLAKRLTPDQLASIQNAMSVSVNRASSIAAAALRTTAAPTTTRPAAVNTAVRTSASTSAAMTQMVGEPLANTPSSSSTTTKAAPSSSSIPSSSSVTTTVRVTTTSSEPLTTSTAAIPTSSLPPVITRTTTPSASTSELPLPTVSAAASNSSSSSSSLSTGAVVGIVLAVLIGVVILGSGIGWVYRKFATRGYKGDSRWRQLDDDITPFPNEKDDNYNDDIYGGSAGPVIGSRRALADEANRDGAYANRPMSEYVSNRAGLGSGRDAQSGPVGYPSQATYGVDVHGRPYNGQAGRVPAQPYNDEYERSHPPSPPTSRQLLGPGYSPPDLTPVPLGRPAPPRSYSDIAFREDYADEPMSAGLPYEPMTARTNEWAGAAQSSHGASQSRRVSGTTSGSKSPSPPLAPMPLPTFAPLSPLDSSFTLHRQSQPMAMYENEPARQKQLYGEVSAFAGFPEPKTPHSAGLDYSASTGSTFNTGTTHSSFSATEHGVRLPIPPVPAISIKPPYEHGRPLSPLVEVATPSTFQSQPVPSSSIGLGGNEYNPFDHLPAPRTLVAPHSASSGGSSFPSAKYPPPSPGGMSLPASVTDSPRRWSGQGTGNVGMARRSRGDSMFDDDDAYGGI